MLAGRNELAVVGDEDVGSVGHAVGVVHDKGRGVDVALAVDDVVCSYLHQPLAG